MERGNIPCIFYNSCQLIYVLILPELVVTVEDAIRSDSILCKQGKIRK